MKVVLIRAKVLTINLEGCGYYLGMEKSCFIIRDKHGNVHMFDYLKMRLGKLRFQVGIFLALVFWLLVVFKIFQ